MATWAGWVHRRGEAIAGRVEHLNARAREIDLARVLGTVLGMLVAVPLWLLGALPGLLVRALAWMAAAVALGYRDARGRRPGDGKGSP